jgi:metalloendopeptidase OMA1, mitochondrial
MVVGRRFRRWWKTLSESEKLKFRNEIKKRSRLWVGLGVASLAGIVYGYQSHVEECPITERRRFVALTPGQVEKIAVTEFQELSEEFSSLMLPESNPYYRDQSYETPRAVFITK